MTQSRILNILSLLFVLGALVLLSLKVMAPPTTSSLTLQPGRSRSTTDALIATPSQLGIVTNTHFRVVDLDEILGAQQAGIQRGDIILAIGGVTTTEIAAVGTKGLLTPLPVPPTPAPLVSRPAVAGQTTPVHTQAEKPYVPTAAESADMALTFYIRDIVLRTNGSPIAVTVLRGGEQLTFQVTPMPAIHPEAAPQPTPIFFGHGLYHF